MRVDTHVHIDVDPARGLFEIENVPIVEYCEKASIPLAGVGGSRAEALAMLAAAGVDGGCSAAAGVRRREPFPDDPGVEGVYDACIEADVPIGLHSGPDIRRLGFPEAAEFAKLAAARPGRKLVLAHLGGGSCRDTLALADANPHLLFDLSEVVIRIRATAGPSAEDVADLVRGIGVERVVTGSDFPW